MLSQSKGFDISINNLINLINKSIKKNLHQILKNLVQNFHASGAFAPESGAKRITG